MNKKTMLQRIFSLFLVAVLMLGVSACDNAKKDEGKKEEVKKEVVKKEKPKKDEPKKDEPKKDEPKKDEPKKEVSKKWNVMATSTMLTDLAKVIGGEKANVTGLMEAGVDPHLYQPSAGDITKLEGSDMIVINGLHLEGQMGKVFKGLTAKNKLVAEVGESVPKEARLPFDESEFDPHIWFSVANWKIAARNVTDTYITLSPADKDYFNQNYEAYVKELDELDKYIRTEVEKVAKPARVLITAHDAFNYFGKEYGFEVMGLQGISTESEASTSDVSELANFIAKNKIKAIFVESSVPRKNVEALQEAVKAKGFNVEIGGELFSDSLGEGKASTYIGMFKENVDIIVGALKE